MSGPTNLTETLAFCRRHGLAVVPIAAGNKKPRDAKWNENPDGSPDDAFRATDNAGLLTGAPVKGTGAVLIDVDIDATGDKALRLVDHVLSTLPRTWEFGRTGKPRSHRLYLVTDPLDTRQIKSGVTGKMLIELRGRTSKGRKFGQTVAPGSTHDSGEPIRFVEPLGTIARVDGAPLDRAVQLAGIGLELLEIWPASGRHNFTLAIAGFLKASGLVAQDTRLVLEALTLGADGSIWQDAESSTASTYAADDPKQLGSGWIRDNIPSGEKAVIAIRKILGIKTLPDGSYLIDDINLKTLTPAVWLDVKRRNDPPTCFLYTGLPSRASQVPQLDNGRRKRPTWALQQMRSDLVAHEVARAASFFKTKNQISRQVEPPAGLVRDMLAMRPEEIPLPIVTRIVYAPTMAPDGSIQTSPGYHPATGTFYVPGDLVVPPVSHVPSMAEVRAAVATLKTPIADFPFVDDASRAHALALLILTFVRDCVDGPTPLHLIKKAIAGEGATLLTDTLLAPALGTDIARLSEIDDDDEWRKEITSTLMEGPSALVFDNMRNLSSKVLAKLFTDTRWKARILGVSKTVEVDVSAVLVATGINPVLHQELTRRSIPIEINSGSPLPWMRGQTFTIPNLKLWNGENRAAMIHAALTLARHWFATGQPKGTWRLGMYESWSEVIGGILAAADIKGFGDNLGTFYSEADVEGDAVQQFIAEWDERHGPNPVKIGDLSLWALQNDSPLIGFLKAGSPHLLTQAFGVFVPSLQKRVVQVGDRQLRVEMFRESDRGSRRLWRVRDVARSDAEVLRDAERAGSREAQDTRGIPF
jgi:hypothetical protein